MSLYYYSTDRQHKYSYVAARAKWKFTPSRPVGILWAVLSVLVSTTAVFSLLQPVWLTTHQNKWAYFEQRKNVFPTTSIPKHKIEKTSPTTHNDHVTSSSFGLYSYCIHSITTAINSRPQLRDHNQNSHLDIAASNRMQQRINSVCRLYGGKNHSFDSLPSSAWQASCIMFGCGSLMLTLSALVAILTSCCDNNNNVKIANIVGISQAVAVTLMAAGVLIFPLGFGSPLVVSQCGQSAGIFQPAACQVGWAYTLAIMSTLLAMFCPFLARYTTFSALEQEPDMETYFA